jgi:hypothetical protein
MKSPSFLKLACNQVAKDLREQRWLVIAWLVFLLIHLAEQWHGGLPEALAAGDTFFERGSIVVCLAFAWLFVARVFFADPAMKLTAFWKSRPLGWWGVLVAKVTTIVLVVVLPLCMEELVAVRATDLPWFDTWRFVIVVGLLLGVWCILTATIATIAGDWPRFLVGWIALLIFPFLWRLVVRINDPITPLFTATGLTLILLPCAWAMRNRVRAIGLWIGLYLTLMIVVMALSGQRKNPEIVLPPLPKDIGYGDFKIYPALPGRKPNFGYYVRPDWLLRGENRKVVFQAATSERNRFAINPYWDPSTPQHYYKELATVPPDSIPGLSGHPDDSPRLRQQPSPETKAILMQGFTKRYGSDNHVTEFGALKPGDTYKGMISVRRTPSTQLVALRLDKPCITRVPGYTIRITHGDANEPTVRIAKAGCLGGEPVKFTLIFIPDDTEEELPVTWNHQGRLPFQDSETYERLRQAVEGRSEPLPAGTLHIYTAWDLPWEHYAVDVPVVSP